MYTEKMEKHYKNIVWDWNGTLLDDVYVGLDTLNCMLDKRDLPVLTLEDYRRTFGFPVEDFYKVVGFDLQRESMHELSVDFVETYDRYAQGVGLHRESREVLENLKNSGVKQYILSALREDLLHEMLETYHIGGYFTCACGSDNIYAAGKIERGKRMVEACGLRPEETLMVGDTLHDAEVAKALGFSVVLYAGGHNSEQRLRKMAPVVFSLHELPGQL